LLQITLQGELNAVAHKELIVKLRQVTRLCEDMYVFLFPLFLIKFPVGFKPLLFHKKSKESNKTLVKLIKKKIEDITRTWKKAHVA
jgi:hypothetical protein